MLHGGIRNGYKRASLEQENKTERFHYLLTVMRADMKCYWRFRRNGGYEKIQAEDLLK